MGTGRLRIVRGIEDWQGDVAWQGWFDFYVLLREDFCQYFLCILPHTKCHLHFDMYIPLQY